MTQEDKELLLKDLCARLPYGVKAILSEYHIDEFPYNGTYCDKVINLGICEGTINLLNHIEKYGVKPYLRPISSMTNEEKGELKLEQEKDEKLFIQVINKSQNGDDSLLGTVIPHYAEDWANKNHFDYRGLIEKGLALEAPDGMYNLNKE